MMPAPLTVSDVRGRADLSDLQFPIFFENVDGKLGIPLEAAAAGQCGTLRNAQEYAQLGAWSTTHICIAVSAFCGQPMQQKVVGLNWIIDKVARV
jgi:hypothetical protein